MRDHATLFRVAPTFPLDDREIREECVRRVARSPVTWGSALGGIGLGILAGAGVLAWAALLAGLGLGLRLYWRGRWSALEAECMGSVIRASNREQDAELRRIIRLLEDRHQPQYALCLGRFLLLKQKIEGFLHDGDRIRAFAPRIEELVDGICAEVCREITGLLEHERALGEALTSRSEERLARFEEVRRESHASILHAYTTLYRTHAELGHLGRIAGTGGTEAGEPDAGEAADRSESLARVVEDLRDETDLLERTNRRLREDLGAAPPAVTVSAPPAALSE